MKYGMRYRFHQTQVDLCLPCTSSDKQRYWATLVGISGIICLLLLLYLVSIETKLYECNYCKYLSIIVIGIFSGVLDTNTTGWHFLYKDILCPLSNIWLGRRFPTSIWINGRTFKFYISIDHISTSPCGCFIVMSCFWLQWAWYSPTTKY